MSKIDEIRATGYDVIPGSTIDGLRVSDVDQNFLSNKYLMVISTPDGRKINFTGHLDDPASIGNPPVMTTRREMINEVFHPTQDDWYEFENGYSKRTGTYLDTIGKKIGLLNCNSYSSDWAGAEDGSAKFEKIGTVAQFINTIVEYGKCEKGYVVQYSVLHDIDSSSYTQMIFGQLPSKEDVWTAIEVKRVKDLLRFRNREVYTCHECGRVVYWLDVTGGFKQKVIGLDESYCGC